ncbi:MAG: glycosyl hydrolase 53 family protein [Lachnospiraceae bacterium]|nr:glycosyl hydrolase 53 family protein [Lachnospiraceae bacterium]
MIQKMAFGVDLGWMTQLEDMGMRWVDESGQETDLLDAVIAKGADSVRLRVFVNPPKDAYWQKFEDVLCMLGYCDRESVLQAAKRIKEKNLRLMIDFHYSDHFADAQIQDIPEAWMDDSDEELIRHVAEHTKEVLTLLKEEGICPEWVQVGNEINPGLLLPRGGLQENPQLMVRLLNSGYDAVKECLPDCQVITHLAGVTSKKGCDPFLDTFFSLGGKTDILGFSYYPYWDKRMNSDEPDRFYNPLITYAKRFEKPVMICEVGEDAAEETLSAQVLANTIEAVLQVPDHQGLGVFYWEPEVSVDMLPDGYPLGAARLVAEKTLQLTEALSVYGKYKGRK